MVKVLAALDVDASNPEAAQAAVADLEDVRWRRMLPPSLVIREGRTPTVDVHVRHGEPVSVWIELETGGTRSKLHQQENWTQPRQLGRPAGRPGDASSFPATCRSAITPCGHGPPATRRRWR